MKTKRFIFLVLFLSVFITGHTQSKYLTKIAKHDFLKLDSNNVKYYGDSTSLFNFYGKLKSILDTKEGNVSIMHVGGSHIQADVWSGRLRSNFQMMEDSMKGERGMVFPLHIAKTNNPGNYKTESTGKWYKCRSAEKERKCDLGLLGYRVRTADTLTSFKIYCYDKYYPLDYDFNKVKIYFDIDVESFTPYVMLNGERKEMNVNSKLGYAEFVFDTIQSEINFEIAKTSNKQHFFELYGLQLENDDPGVIYHNIGINGADVPAYNNSKFLEKHLKSVVPDLVVFSIGINDAYDSEFTAEQYKLNYDTLIQTFRKVNPDVNILFTTNNDSYRKGKPNERAFEVKEVMKQLCKEHNTAMWDMFEVMGGIGSIDKWVAKELAKKDRIHLKNEGYKLIGNLMFNALMNDYQRFENGLD